MGKVRGTFLDPASELEGGGGLGGEESVKNLILQSFQEGVEDNASRCPPGGWMVDFDQVDIGDLKKIFSTKRYNWKLHCLYWSR